MIRYLKRHDLDVNKYIKSISKIYPFKSSLFADVIQSPIANTTVTLCLVAIASACFCTKYPLVGVTLDGYKPLRNNICSFLFKKNTGIK